MRHLKDNLDAYLQTLPIQTKLIVVTKTQPIERLKEVYQNDYKIFGENRVQELVDKYNILAKDIEWHLIGHLQKNKVKYIASFVYMIHAVDSLELLEEINKQAKKQNRTIKCLLQVHIAQEETKFGFSPTELVQLAPTIQQKEYSNIIIAGLMAMASNTTDEKLIRNEFKEVRLLFQQLQPIFGENFIELSMGMTNDYLLAVEEGSTMVRVGSGIFKI